MPVELLRRRFTVDDYHRMAKAGILGDDDRVELIDGEIFEVAPIGSRHASTVNRLNRLLSQYSGGRFLVSAQNPIQLGEQSEPQPDIALLRLRPDFYASSHPKAEDVLLVVEVADTTVQYDREVKLPLYAGSGIVETWLVNIDTETIEVYRQPGPQGYRESYEIRRGENLGPEAVIDVILAAVDILGPES